MIWSNNFVVCSHAFTVTRQTLDAEQIPSSANGKSEELDERDDQTGFTEGDFDHLSAGWHSH
jgi:hypothetical protein